MARAIRLIGIPMDLGQDLRGVDMGPSALRYAGLADRLERLGHTVEDMGNIDVAVRGSLQRADSGLTYLPEIAQICSRAYEVGKEAIDDGCLPIFIGGDHSISAGTVGGVTEGSRVGVLWIDAHGDFNTPETSPSGNVHGMPLAALLGLGAPEIVNVGREGPKVDREDVMMIGIRSLDPSERQLVRDHRVGIYTMREIDEKGIAQVAHEVLQRLNHTERLHVSLDMDSLDPTFAPGVGTPVQGGLTTREAHLLMEILADDGRVGSIDIVEINPILDEKNQTAQLAAGLLTSLLGKSIL